MLANIFGASPVMPLEKHVDIACNSVSELSGFFAAAIDGDWDAAGRVLETINALEHEADSLKKDIRQHLPKSLLMPVPRGDILALLLVQDQMANRAQKVATLVQGRRLVVPAAIADEFREFLERNIDAAKQARSSVRELDELFTTGFRGAEAALVEKMLEKLDQIETDTDDRETALRASLFAIEKEFDPVDTMFLYRVIELIGEIADIAERVGRRLEVLCAH
jgi:predicted phosphate transport protein (TIGR00153 family)